MSTTLVNAYVAPRIARYVANLTERLRAAGYDGPLLLMQSTGGVMTPDSVERRAVTLLGSGPTGGVMGAAVAAARRRQRTSWPSTWAAPASTCASSGAGSRRSRPTGTGGTATTSACPWSTCRASARAAAPWRVRQGALLVGPEAAGSTPGPACYGRGGDRPTVTDADAVLGYLPLEGFAGGRMTLDVDAARAAIERDVGEPLDADMTEAAWGIERIVNTNMANATRRVLAGYGADPRDLAMIAYGGNGAVHAVSIAAELGIERILVPKAAPAFSALGLLVADYVVDLVRSYVVPALPGGSRPAPRAHGRAGR